MKIFKHRSGCINITGCLLIASACNIHSSLTSAVKIRSCTAISNRGAILMLRASTSAEEPLWSGVPCIKLE